MKSRFNTYDIICMVTELQRLIGMRVNQVYDIDNKTYLIRLQRSEEKSVLLLESGNRFHTTDFEWPKNVAPSGFSMKLRKHLKNKRLESLKQLGIDRIVDLQFGSGEAAYHVILELYDRGNIVLTDYEWTILNVLRPHVEGDKIRFAVKEKYPLDRAKVNFDPPDENRFKEIFSKSKATDNLKKILNPNLEYGPAIIDHILLENGLAGNMKLSNDPNKGFFLERDLGKLINAVNQAEMLMENARSQIAKGYITQKKEERATKDNNGPAYFLTNIEFHPMLFNQHKNQPIAEYETFDRAVDEFYSALEGQKIDIKTIQIEREALKKLDNVRKDHDKRVSELVRVQTSDERAAELIARNSHIVEQCTLAVQTAIANQMSWNDIKDLVSTAQANNDPIACHIKELKLKTNHITLLLNDPYEDDQDEDDVEGSGDKGKSEQSMLVDIDLSLTAHANARRYYDQKRSAAKKQMKTLESAGKALKSAERKTKQTLKEAQTISNISKARKTYWFEKFYWFISSDNFLVIAGRDQQQNELLVKRYMRSTDIYVHADLSGASSVIVKNPSGEEIPPRTLAEAGHAAVAYSVAWEAKVLTTAWWVRAAQVSKSAPTGEYLTTGSFMIRGKKNYLLPQHLQLGFSFMFRLEDGSIERHLDDRKPQTFDDTISDVTSATDQDEEIAVSDGDEDEQSDLEKKEDKKDDGLDVIIEESVQANPGDTEKSEKDPDKLQNEEIKKELDTKTESDSESESDNESDGAFPDTHVKVDHGTGVVITESKARTFSEVSDRSDEKPLTFPSLPNKSSKKNAQNKSKQQPKENPKPKDGLKRGQRGKLKKMKEKYKDQDDEDRALAMELLQSSNASKDSKKAQKKAAGKGQGTKNRALGKPQKIPQPVPQLLEADSDPDEAEAEAEVGAGGAGAAEEALRQLTGAPLAEDELLFAVPVVAPYAALHAHKFKVKLTPGTSKRGKAAKTAIQVFLKDKDCSPRERDLLKAVKEEDVARNFPGKVKLSAPQLHRHKK